jgi:hypothetical protein
VSDRHSYAQLTRFIPQPIVDRFEKISLEPVATTDTPSTAAPSAVRQKIAAMWE